MSVFNPDAFLTQESTESNDTSFAPIPEGDYTAVIKEIKPRTTSTGKAVMDVVWAIDDQDVREATGLSEPTVRQSIFLDLTDAGGLDFGKGKNVQLGKLREALGQNTPGQAWSPAMLSGNVARVNIKHRIVDQNIYADVKGVAKA